MSDTRTVLPAPKLLDLIGVRATQNAITLAARTSSRVARCRVRWTRPPRRVSRTCPYVDRESTRPVDL
jgi:hypothetical protein